MLWTARNGSSRPSTQRAYIDGAYNAAVAMAGSRKNAAANTKALLGNGTKRQDSAGISSAEAARRNMVNRQLRKESK